MRSTGGDLVSSALLRVVVASPSQSRGGAAAAHARRLVATLRDAGHEVTVVSPASRHLASGPPGARGARGATWARTLRRLREADAILLVHAGASSVPGQLALVRGLGALLGSDGDGPGSAALVLVAGEPLTRSSHGAARRLTESLVRRCDAALVHDHEQAFAATALGARRVCMVPLPGGTSPSAPADLFSPGRSAPVGVGVAAGRSGPVSSWRRPGRGVGGTGAQSSDTGADPADWPVLPADWARYVGAIETLAAPLPPVEPLEGADEPSSSASLTGGHPRRGRGVSGASGTARATARAMGAAVVARVRLARAGRVAARPVVALARLDLPDWVVPTDVLLDPLDADDARGVAVGLGLPTVADTTSAWAALGALVAVVRLVDDGRRSAVIVHESARSGAPGEGTSDDTGDDTSATSPFGRWAAAAGFAPVALGLTDPDAPLADLDLDLASLDAVVRIHPDGCDADDVDEAVGQAAWALRRGGILVVTVPLARAGVAGALTPADLRGVVARAHACGLALVGDLDGDLTARLSTAASAARTTAGADDTAYGLARLVLRRA